MTKQTVYPTGTEVQLTFKLTEEVKVEVDFTTEKDYTKEELRVEGRNRLERAGLDRNLQEVPF